MERAVRSVIRIVAMSVFTKSALLLSSSAIVLSCGFTDVAMSQDATAPGISLPQIDVKRPKQARVQRRTKPQPVVAARREAAPPPPSEAQVVAEQTQVIDRARRNLAPPIGTAPYFIDRSRIEALPQGANASLDKVLLQAPGVTQDSGASGELHIRNEH